MHLKEILFLLTFFFLGRVSQAIICCIWNLLELLVLSEWGNCSWMHVNCEIMGNWTSIIQLLYSLVSSRLKFSICWDPIRQMTGFPVCRVQFDMLWRNVLRNFFFTFSQIIVIACHGAEVLWCKYCSCFRSNRPDNCRCYAMCYATQMLWKIIISPYVLYICILCKRLL